MPQKTHSEKLDGWLKDQESVARNGERHSCDVRGLVKMVHKLRKQRNSLIPKDSPFAWQDLYDESVLREASE